VNQVYRLVWKWCFCSWAHREHRCYPTVWRPEYAKEMGIPYRPNHWHCQKCVPCWPPAHDNLARARGTTALRISTRFSAWAPPTFAALTPPTGGLAAVSATALAILISGCTLYRHADQAALAVRDVSTSAQRQIETMAPAISNMVVVTESLPPMIEQTAGLVQDTRDWVLMGQGVTETYRMPEWVWPTVKGLLVALGGLVAALTVAIKLWTNKAKQARDNERTLDMVIKSVEKAGLGKIDKATLREVQTMISPRLQKAVRAKVEALRETNGKEKEEGQS